MVGQLAGRRAELRESMCHLEVMASHEIKAITSLSFPALRQQAPGMWARSRRSMWRRQDARWVWLNVCYICRNDDTHKEKP